MAALGNVVSGKSGKVKESGTAIAHVTKWEADLMSDNPKYVSSSTGGATGRVAGNTDFSGSFECIINTDAGVRVVRGSYYTLEGHIDASGNNYYSFPCIIKSVKHAVDIEGAKEQRVTCTFEANGDYTKNGTI